MPDASTLRSGSPPRGGSVLRTNLAISPERTMRIENGGPGGRRGNTEEQYGHVNWAATLRQKVWDDKLQRYIGVNPAAELGEDWRQRRNDCGSTPQNCQQPIVHTLSA